MEAGAPNDMYGSMVSPPGGQASNANSKTNEGKGTTC